MYWLTKRDKPAVSRCLDNLYIFRSVAPKPHYVCREFPKAYSKQYSVYFLWV